MRSSVETVSRRRASISASLTKPNARAERQETRYKPTLVGDVRPRYAHGRVDLHVVRRQMVLARGDIGFKKAPGAPRQLRKRADLLHTQRRARVGRSILQIAQEARARA